MINVAEGICYYVSMLVTTKQLVKKLASDYPDMRFVSGNRFYWSPKDRTIYYAVNTSDKAASWALLHELCHGLLGHQNYRTDFELLKLEVAAWQEATTLAKKYDIVIEEDHIQDCLDTYRDWLHARSTCPACTEHGLQQSEGGDSRTYVCINCNNTWRVSSQRFCRPYRRLKIKD